MTITTSPLWHIEQNERLSRRAIGAFAIAALGLLYGIAIFIVARRAMGAFTTKLDDVSLLSAALIAFAVVTGIRVAWRRAQPEPTVFDGWIAWGSSLTLILLAGGLSYPARDERDWLIWLPILIADQILRWKLSSPPRQPVESFASRPKLSGSATQQFTRSLDSADKETVHATLRADFQPGQRNATVYLGFCPPLAAVPQIAAEVTSGPVAELKVVQSLPHGVRIDVRLAAVAMENTSVVLSVVASQREPESAEQQLS